MRRVLSPSFFTRFTVGGPSVRAELFKTVVLVRNGELKALRTGVREVLRGGRKSGNNTVLREKERE